MKLARVIFKCMRKRCGKRETFAEMPAEQPLYPACRFPMKLLEVKAVGQ